MRSLRSAFWNIPTGCRFSFDQLEMALELLVRIDLISEENGELWPSASLEDFGQMSIEDVSELVLVELLTSEAPLWLRAGMLSDGRFAREAVPDDTLERIDALIEDHERRDAVLLSVGHKVDVKWRSEVGMMGELSVVEEIKRRYIESGRPHLSRSIQHVSLVSDTLGYDIACSTLDDSRIRRLEVKTSASWVSIRIFVTRNEIKRGLSDSEWRLLVCLLEDDGVRVLGWMMPIELLSRLPVDAGSAGSRWENASLVLDASELSPGLPLD